MSSNPPVVDYDLAIIGSGIAGLAAARAAKAKGLSVKFLIRDAALVDALGPGAQMALPLPMAPNS